MSRETIYVVEEGEYSDYRVLCAFRSEDDARRAVAAGLGDGYRAMILFGEGEQPVKAITRWKAYAAVGVGLQDAPPIVRPHEEWDYREAASGVWSGRPEVREHHDYAGRIWINVTAATRDEALKACSDRYARRRGEREGLAS